MVRERKWFKKNTTKKNSVYLEREKQDEERIEKRKKGVEERKLTKVS